MREKRGDLVFTAKIFVCCLALCGVIFLLCAIFDIATCNTYVAEVEEKVKLSVIVDAGHGGRDGGALGANGAVEKDLNLSVARSLRDILLLCDVEVVMTRNGDSLVCDENDPSLKGRLKTTDLNNRLKISRENPKSVFVSIHMNKYPIEKYSGLQVYYSPNNECSSILAKDIQDKVAEILQPNNNRKIKKAGSNIFLLNRITSPAVLIECGFLSNENESEKLYLNEYRTKLAMIFAECIVSNANNLGIIYPNA